MNEDEEVLRAFGLPRKHKPTFGPVVLALILMVTGLTWVFWPAPAAQAGKKQEPYVPNVIPVPQEHAWCYVLVNENRATGNINMFACVPKQE